MELDYGRLDPELLPALETFPALDLDRDNIAKIRALLAERPQPPFSVDVLADELKAPSADGDVTVYRFRKSDAANQAALIWIHGGGYIMGNADEDRARIIAHECECTVFSVDYRLAPEHPFPAGPDDCFATLRWVMNNADDLGIDPARVAIGGASAGGGMAAGVALMNRDRDNFPLRLQLLLYPMIDNLHETISGKYTNHPVWKQRTSFNAWDMYLNGKPALDASPYAAATRAADLGGLPPAYICVGAEDLFRDEDIAYAQRLITAGIACELAVYPGLYHGADSFVPKARVSRRLNEAFMRALTDSLA